MATTETYLSIPQVGHHSRPGSSHSPHASQCFPSGSSVVSSAIGPLLCRLDGHSSYRLDNQPLRRNTTTWMTVITTIRIHASR